jgi:A/G-specific adenine glycosylase
VLCRLFGWAEDPRSGPALERLWNAAEAILPDEDVGDFNQALMELGALLCTPTGPRCLFCPLAEACAARKQGLQEKIPVRAPKPEPISVREVAVVIRRGPRVLLVQRPAEGRWANMWEFPHAEVGAANTQAARKLALKLTGMDAEPNDELITLKHSVTHHRITLTCFDAAHRSGKFRSSFYQRAVWLLPAKLADYPVSAPQRRLAGLLVDSL